jgi:hypothetical protein
MAKPVWRAVLLGRPGSGDRADAARPLGCPPPGVQAMLDAEAGNRVNA